MSDPWSALLRQQKDRAIAAQPPAPVQRRRMTKFAPGDRVGEWKLLEYHPGHHARNGQPRKRAYWMCQCSCGVKRAVQADNLTYGLSKSCGHALANSRWRGYQPVTQ